MKLVRVVWLMVMLREKISSIVRVSYETALLCCTVSDGTVLNQLPSGTSHFHRFLVVVGCRGERGRRSVIGSSTKSVTTLCMYGGRWPVLQDLVVNRLPRFCSTSSPASTLHPA